MKVTTKEEMYRLWRGGAFGNRPRSWLTWNGLLASGYRGKVGLRYAEPASPFCCYGLEIRDVPQILLEWEMKGADPALIRFGEMAPDEFLTLQGEVMLSADHYELTYSTLPMPMREGLRLGMKTARGLEAAALLRARMCPSSYEDLQALFDLYPDSIVEFSCYSRDVGMIPNRNTLFWEVRNY